MKQTLLYGLLLLLCSFVGFAGTLYLLPEYDEVVEQSRLGTLPQVINQEFEGVSTSELVQKGRKLWLAKDYVRSFPLLEAGYNNSRPNSSLRRKATLFLGLSYYYGQGTKINLDRAHRLFSLPDFSNSRQVVFLTGLMYKNREFSGYDLEKARIYLKKAEGMGIKKAGIELAKLGQ